MSDWLDNMIGVGNLPTDITNPTVDFTDPSVWNWQTNLGPDDRPITIDTSDAVVPPASLPGGVETADQTYRTSPGSANLTDWAKIVKALTSPAGIAGLGGAALGYLDRPGPSGGGTTMAYPGAAQLQRKMVQGPYGPLAEYTGVGGGAPDYTPFTAPTFGAPDVGGRPAPTTAPSPGAGMSVQSKVDLYKQMAGYGLAPDRIRRIAESMFGPQTDTDWNELTRLAGVGAGIAAPKPGGITTPSGIATPAPIAAPAPASAPVANVGSVVIGGPPPAAASAPAPAPTSSGFNTLAASDYIKYRKLPGGSGGSASDIKSMLEQTYGPQSQEQLDAYERAYKEHMDYMASQAAAPAPTPAPTPAPVAAPAAPEVSEGYKYATQEGGMGEDQFYENIANFIRNNPDEAAQKQAQKEYGISDADVYRAKLRHNLLGNTGFFAVPPPRGFARGGEAQAYAGGRPLTMEDGGFVFTEKATDELGPRGIAALGGKRISAPGNGTDDKGITSIMGRHGATPARVSNGESYFPPGHDTKQLYALMNSLERKA